MRSTRCWTPRAGSAPSYSQVAEWLAAQSKLGLKRKQQEAEILFRRLGITFSVYGSEDALERLIPFDLVPRIISAAEWRLLERGIEQRVRALNAFLYDIYHRQEIIRAGRIPADLVLGNEAYLPEMIGHNPPLNVYSHIIGVDIVRVSENEFYVLEDNLRTPSGVSYMLENRETMMHLFPELFASHRVAPIGQYPELLLRTLQAVAPPACKGDPKVAVLTPGIYNSAFFEHSFLADQMGVELVEGQDLFVEDGYLYMRTTQGRERLDVIYRRIDDDYLDPLTFRPDSDARRAGPDGSLSRRPRDDRQRAGQRHRRRQGGLHLRAGDHPVLHRPAADPAERADLALLDPGRAVHVLEHLAELVVKEVHGSGGYGMLVGPTASRKEIEAFPREAQGAAGELHRPADAGALDLPVRDAERHRAAPRRPPALRARRRPRADRAGRAHPRGAEEGLARRQFLAGRRHQGHLGAAGLGERCWAHRRKPVLDVAADRARENMARLAEAGFASRSRPTPATAIARSGTRRWRAPASSDSSSRNTATASFEEAIGFILFDDDNTSSVRSCLKSARTNARAVRTKITRDMWEAMNSTWLAYEAIKPAEITAARLPELLDWIRAARRAFPRRAARHDPARRRLLLQPARRFRRARRQHGAHPRRQILHPAAVATR